MGGEPGRWWRQARRLGAVSLPGWATRAVAYAAICSPLLLYLPRMAAFSLDWDDFPLVRDCLSWQRLSGSVWQPISTHFCPLFRLWTWALVAPTQSLTAVPGMLCVGAMASLLVALAVLFELVRRETGSVAGGLAAVLVGGMTSVYFRAVGTYALSQALWAAATTLVVLLYAQRAVRFVGAAGDRSRAEQDSAAWVPAGPSRPRWRSAWFAVAGGTVAALVAPAWFAAGLLAGPVAALYVLAARPRAVAGPPISTGHLRADRGQLLLGASAPLLGTLMFVLAALWVSGSQLLQPGNFAGQGPWQAFRPVAGAWLTARCLTEQLLFWTLALPVQLDLGQFLVWSPALVAGLVWWFRRSPHPPLAACGLGLMLGSCLLIYSFRSYMGLATLRTARWYLVFPHLGWTLFVVAGIDWGRAAGRRASMSVRTATVLAALGLGLYLLHRPVAAREARAMENPAQRRQLQRLELVRQVSDRWGIEPEQVRQAVGPQIISGSDGFDGLELLEPPPPRRRRWPVAAVRRGLERVWQTGSPDEFRSGQQRLDHSSGDTNPTRERGVRPKGR